MLERAKRYRQFPSAHAPHTQPGRSPNSPRVHQQTSAHASWGTQFSLLIKQGTWCYTLNNTTQGLLYCKKNIPGDKWHKNYFTGMQTLKEKTSFWQALDGSPSPLPEAMSRAETAPYTFWKKLHFNALFQKG